MTKDITNPKNVETYELTMDELNKVSAGDGDRSHTGGGGGNGTGGGRKHWWTGGDNGNSVSNIA